MGSPFTLREQYTGAGFDAAPAGATRSDLFQRDAPVSGIEANSARAAADGSANVIPRPSSSHVDGKVRFEIPEAAVSLDGRGKIRGKRNSDTAVPGIEVHVAVTRERGHGYIDAAIASVRGDRTSCRGDPDVSVTAADFNLTLRPVNRDVAIP